MKQVLQFVFGWSALALGLGVLIRHGQAHPELRVHPTRLLTYSVSRDNPLRFQMNGDSGAVRLVTWRTLATEWAPDPRITTPYCLQAALQAADGSTRATWTRWLSTRRSTGVLPELPRLPAAWIPDAPTLVSDDRQTVLVLPDGVRSDDTLLVRRCDENPEDSVLLVAYATSERNSAVQARLANTTRTEAANRVLSQYSARDWLDLPEDWRLNLVAERWARLAALDAGDPIPTTEVHTTFARTPWRDASPTGVRIPPGGAAVYNLEGETRLYLAWKDSDGQAVDPMPMRIQVVRGDGKTEQWVRDTWDPALAAGPGVRSVHIGLPPDAAAPLGLVAWTEGGSLDRAWGDPPRSPIEDQRQWVSPDVRNETLARALPEETPLRYALDGSTETVRFRFVVPLAPDLPGLSALAPPEIPGPTVNVTARDAAGAALDTWTQSLLVQPSIYERYTQRDTPATAAASLPIDAFYSPPLATTTLDITATAPVDVLVKVKKGLEGIHDIPWDGYDRTTTSEARRRFVPLLRSEWEVRAPQDAEALLLAHRLPRLDLQVRLEPLDAEPEGEDNDGPAKWSYLPLTFYGNSNTERFPLEMVAEADPDGRANAGSRVRIGTRRAVVDIPASGRLTMDYVLSPERLQEPLVLRVAGEEYPQTLRTTTGSLLVHNLPPGRQDVSVDVPAGSPLARDEFLLARSEGGWPLWNTRKVRQVQPGQTLSVAPLAAGPARVRVVVLGASDVARLQWTLEVPDGFDATGVPLQGEEALRPSTNKGWLVSQGARVLDQSMPVTLRLPENLPYGARLHLSVANTRGPVYLRALATWSSPSTETVRLWGADTPEATP